MDSVCLRSREELVNHYGPEGVMWKAVVVKALEDVMEPAPSTHPRDIESAVSFFFSGKHTMRSFIFDVFPLSLSQVRAKLRPYVIDLQRQGVITTYIKEDV